MITKKLIPVLAMCIGSCCAPIQSFAQVPEISIEDAKKAADYLTFNADGSVCCEQDGSLQTGKFSLEPNFLLGDINHDGTVNATDAAIVLIRAADKGASADGSISGTDALYGDVNEDNDVNASDAANILYYSALEGAGQEVSPLGYSMYYADENGALQKGWIEAPSGERYFAAEDYRLMTGWMSADFGRRYYFNKEGIQQRGWLELEGNTYYFGNDGISKGECQLRSTGTGADDLVNHASLSPRRTITVYDQQEGAGKELVSFSFTLSDEDIAIIEQFADEHFPEDATLAEKLYITHQWIHYNNEYAYAGELWDEIVGLSYVDAIFNHQKGQCVQYNGAMASVLAYYGFDVYMIKGYTKSGNQHFWTQVEIDDKTYLVECGNSVKNGDWWQSFFTLVEE